MNLLLLESRDFLSENRAVLRGRRRDHLLEVQGVSVGDRLRAGTVNGLLGHATVVALREKGIELDCDFDRAPPAPLPVILVLALPRPKMLKRVLQSVASMGVKQLVLLNSQRVEPSYWKSPVLGEARIREQLLLGLEQCGDTQLPEVKRARGFKPFVEDELPRLCRGRRALVAQPREDVACPPPSPDPTLLVVGPEGGFIEYELQKLIDAGCTPIHLGPRVLRVEVAVPVLLARLFPV